MSSRVAAVRAQAKINLNLRVLARETSGYHQVETLLCRIELSDLVRVSANDSAARNLDCVGPALPPFGLGKVEENLAWRAAVAYAQVTGFPRGFDITVEKHIPVGAGLGGGSADAGAVLRLLNGLSPEPLSSSQLVGIGAALGADVPFVTQDESPLAQAWGRGDRILTLPPLPARSCLLLLPTFGVNTAEAYGWLDMGRAGDHEPALIPLAHLTDWPSVDSLSRNDFEGPVFARHPGLRTAFDRLAAAGRAPGSLVRMSGSGSTIFGLGLEADSIPRTGIPAGYTLRQTCTSTSVARPELLESPTAGYR